MSHIAISKHGVLGRFYQLWLDLGGKEPSYMQLCDLTFILLVRAPLRWFFYRTWGSAWVRPWTMTLTGVFLILAVALPSVWLAFKTFVAILAITVVAFFAIAVISSGLVEVVPVIWRFINKDLGFKPYIDAAGNALNNVLFHKVMGGLPFWVIIPATLLLVLGILDHVVLLVILGYAIGIFTVFALLDAIGDYHVPQSQAEYGRHPVSDGVRETFSLAGAYVRAKKKKICPSVTFTE